MGKLQSAGIRFFCILRDCCKFCFSLVLIILGKLKHVGIRLLYWFIVCCKFCLGLMPLVFEKLKQAGKRIFCWLKNCFKFCFALLLIIFEKIKRAGIQIYRCRKRIFNFVNRNVYQILYLVMLGALWTYIVLNWEKCVSMQFFSQFDGNNILFLVGILLVILPFYEVEGGGVKIRKSGGKELERALNEAESEYRKILMQQMLLTQSQGAPCKTEATENE